jgi:predicted RNA-binding Zn ribbon-like protein
MPGQGSNDMLPDEGRQGNARTGEPRKGEKIVATRSIRQPSSRLEAGDVSLDFVNTLHPDDFLLNAADLIRWSRDVGLVTAEGAQALLAETASYPEASGALFTQIMALREASHRVLLALIQQTLPASHDVQVLQTVCMQARSHEHLVPTEHHLAWQGESADSGLAQLHWSLSRSVEKVLTSPSIMARVKQCPPSRGGCGWLFIDRSKNSSRQWCSDQACGSLLRMRRLYARKRAEL